MQAGAEEGLSDAAFYRALLALDSPGAIDAILDEALDLLVRRTGARQALIEILADEGGEQDGHVVAYGCQGERVAEIRQLTSRGIIASAVATGKTVLTTNAAEDPRFLAFESVRTHMLEAVLCAPVGHDVPVGIVYLQGWRPLGDAARYAERLRDDVQMLAGALATPVDRLLARSRASVPPPKAPRADESDPFASVCGRGTAIRDVVDRLRLAAPLDVHVLLTGPSGSGKTLLAHATHLASRRRHRRFVEINCATLPEALLENELFGAQPGAHATVPKTGLKGKVEAAEGGTLFLDEIAELSLGAQAKLLQLLQSKTYFRLGGVEQVRADVRVVVATNVNLTAAVAEKRFRQDLYFRLKVLEVRVPSLAERSEDLVALSVRFLREAVERHELTGKTLAPSAIRAIQLAEWPGNVRELAHQLESAALHAHLRGSEWVESRDVFPDSDGAPSDETTRALQAATRRFQRQHVLGILQSTDWNIAETGRVLDVSRSHVYNLIRTFDLKRTS